MSCVTLENLRLVGTEQSGRPIASEPGKNQYYISDMYLAHRYPAGDSATIPSTVTMSTRLPNLRVLTLELEDFEALLFTSDILRSIPTSNGELQCLTFIWHRRILAELNFNAFDPDTPYPQVLKLLEESIANLLPDEVVFSVPHCRKNRPGLWSTVLKREFSGLEEYGILKITETSLDGKCTLNSLFIASVDIALVTAKRISSLSEATTGHDNAVSSLAASLDGTFFASSSEDGTIFLWDSHEETIVREWVGHPSRGGVSSIAFSPDSRYIVSGGHDRTIKVWDTSKQFVEEVQSLEASGGTVGGFLDPDATDDTWYQCAWSADGKWIAASSETRKMYLWDARSFRQLRMFEERVALWRSVFFSPDSRWLVWPSPSCIWLWDALEPDAPPRSLRVHPTEDRGPPKYLSFDPFSTYLVTVHGNCLQMWDLVTGTLLAVMEGHMNNINSAVFSPDGWYILSASADGTSKIWLANSGECIMSIEGHEGQAITQALFSPDGNCFAAVSDDFTIRLWRPSDGSCLATFTDHQSSVLHIVFSLDGKKLVSGDYGGVVHIRDISHIVE